ncbi:hypothetical protein TRICI_001563 [Trichomonascus ciferrii]|uniref:Large ribosomal subunit protein mL44 n=1 Tax=Trichomonascus ciferrii TaxID=44093 RepID=A0A642V8Z9_9ASCO|nr:hypothetical protein TRICI_001563 [Trichomonascus ciferrii]
MLLRGLRRGLVRQYSTATKNLYRVPEDVRRFSEHNRADKTPYEPIDDAVARKSPRLLALHSRLGLEESFAYSTLGRALICRSADLKFADNAGMARFGKELISLYVHEYFTVKYPRLPPTVLKHVVGLYSSVKSLARVGSNMGVEVDSRPPLARYLAEEKDEDLLGKLVYTPETTEREAGVIEVLEDEKIRTDQNEALASFVRALVAGTYAHCGLERARELIHSYIIRPHKIDMSSLLAFDQPTRELAVLCAREGLAAPVSRLMFETGRYSRAPVFVVGVFSGKSKLGEGQGSSLKEAKTRASVNALKGWYLYSPQYAKLPSDPSFSPDSTHIDQGVVIV